MRASNFRLVPARSKPSGLGEPFEWDLDGAPNSTQQGMKPEITSQRESFPHAFTGGVQLTSVLDRAEPQRFLQTACRSGTSDAATCHRFELSGLALGLDVFHSRRTQRVTQWYQRVTETLMSWERAIAIVEPPVETLLPCACIDLSPRWHRGFFGDHDRDLANSPPFGKARSRGEPPLQFVSYSLM
jgi:hypothetical protein